MDKTAILTPTWPARIKMYNQNLTTRALDMMEVVVDDDILLFAHLGIK